MFGIAQAQLCRSCSRSRPPAGNTPELHSSTCQGLLPTQAGTFPIPDNNVGFEVQWGKFSSQLSVFHSAWCLSLGASHFKGCHR